MKKIVTLFFAIALFGITFTSCKNDAKEIEKTTFLYFNAFRNADFEKAKLFATKETDNFLTFLSQLLASQNENVKELAVQDAKAVKTSIVEIEIDNDTAFVYYIDKRTDEKKSIDEDLVKTLELRKENGRWLVHQAKEGPARVEGGDDEEPITETDIAETQHLDSLPSVK